MATNAELVASVANLKLQNESNRARIAQLRATIKSYQDTAASPVDDSLVADINAVSKELQDGPA